jgi:N-formylglutamate deformylase
MHTAETSAPLLSDDAILAALADFTLPPRYFNHRGHLRAAWIHLQRYPLEEAITRVCAGIRAFAEHLGATAKYSRTLTEALLRIMHARGAADPARGFESFLVENPDLLHDARGVLRRHYSDELLGSDAARLAFVPPDREPLPGS